MIKKTVAAVVAASILTACAIPAFAEDATYDKNENMQTAVSTPLEKTELSLEDAIKLAKENNPRVVAADAAIKSAELNLEVVKETQKDYDKMTKHVTVPIRVSDGLDAAYLKHGYYPFAATTGLELAKIEKEKVLAAIEYEVTERYFNVKLMEELVKIGKTGLELAQANAAVIKKNYELGYVSELEVKNVENSVKKSEFSLEGYKRNLEIAKESLKISLQLEDSDVELLLTDEALLPQMPQNADEMIKNAIDTRYDVTAVKKNYELCERRFDIANDYVSATTAQYYTQYSEYTSAKYTYENTRKLIALSLKSEYSALLSAKDEVETAKGDVDIKTTEYESAKIRFDMGIITNLELTAAMAELDSAKVQYENAKTAYLLAVKKFEYNTAIGI